jgi:hypothetical protein
LQGEQRCREMRARDALDSLDLELKRCVLIGNDHAVLVGLEHRARPHVRHTLFNHLVQSIPDVVRMGRLRRVGCCEVVSETAR